MRREVRVSNPCPAGSILPGSDEPVIPVMSLVLSA